MSPEPSTNNYELLELLVLSEINYRNGCENLAGSY